MKTKRNFSLGIKIASILSAVAILSVGFASWLIVSNPDDASYDTGSFQIETVEMRTAKIAVNTSKTTEEGTKIVFGAPENADNESKWLKAPTDAEGKIITEHLTATIVFDITAIGKDASGKEFSINEAIKDLTITLGELPSIYKTAKVGEGDAAKRVLADPVVKYKLGDGAETTADLTDGAFTITDFTSATETSVELTLTLTFDWGEATEGQNPFTYFNNEYETPTTDEATEAYNVLHAIQALDEQPYKLTVSGTVKDN